MNSKFLFAVLALVVLFSGCVEFSDYTDVSLVPSSVEIVPVYFISNFTGTFEMIGNADRFSTFIPYSGNIQTVIPHVPVDSRTDEYGNKIVLADGEYFFKFDFTGGSTKNILSDYPYPFTAPSEHSVYLEKTDHIDPEDSEIHRIRTELTHGLNSSFEVIDTLAKWVNDYIFYTRSGERNLNTPQILLHKQGTCEEFARLYAALARNSGIPTRVVMGWVNNGTDIDSHMWAESYVPGNGWLFVDPSSGESGVMGNPYLKVYVGPDKLPEEYYSYRPVRNFNMTFNSVKYYCVFRDGSENCEKQESSVSNIFMSL